MCHQNKTKQKPKKKDKDNKNQKPGRKSTLGSAGAAETRNPLAAILIGHWEVAQRVQGLIQELRKLGLCEQKCGQQGEHG